MFSTEYCDTSVIRTVLQHFVLINSLLVATRVCHSVSVFLPAQDPLGYLVSPVPVIVFHMDHCLGDTLGWDLANSCAHFEDPFRNCRCNCRGGPGLVDLLLEY